MQRAELRITRRRYLATLAAGFGMTVGCHSFNPFRERTETRTDTTAPSPEPGAPWKYTTRVPPYLFFSDFEVEKTHPVFRELSGLRDQVYKELQLPPSTGVVQVYLFETRERYDAFLQARYPGLELRRAYFIQKQQKPLGGTDDLLVYTSWGDNTNIQQDLRHELTHALLHMALKAVPQWLDEGLAEYFELPPENQGVNAGHVRKLRARKPAFQPDLARLENIGEAKQMSRADYHESWAWVYLMLRGKPEAKKVLLDYLVQLRSTPNPPLLGPNLAKVFSSPEEELAHHLERIDLDRVTSTAAP